MKLLLWAILFTCTLCFSQENRDTVYVEVITRDTVFIPIKPKTDTIYINSQTSPTTSPTDTVSTVWKPNTTAINPHLFYLHIDLIGALNTFIYIPALSASIEAPFNSKNSLLFNYAYAKKEPSQDYGETFNDWIYKGSITQHAIGLSYRHYIKPQIRATYHEIGSYFLLRKCNYINTWDNTNLINERPHSDDGLHYGIQLHLQQGHSLRDNLATLGIEYGFAYNIMPSFDDEILKKHIMYLTSGLQFFIRVNLGIGLL